MEIQPGSGWFGLPMMIAVAVVIAAFTATENIGAVVLALVGVVVVFLAIGLAITIAKRS